MSFGKRLRPVLGALGCALPLIMAANPSAPLQWEQLPPIPDAVGFAGSYAGVSQDVLLVAGGANFPDKLPWEGGTKVWHDRIFALERGASAWREAGRLPQAAGYGVSLSTAEGVLLIGGGDARRNFSDVLRTRWNGEAVEFEKLPALPVPLAMQAGALLGRTVYIAGGLADPAAPRPQSVFLALDLDDLAGGWKTLESWPGPPRMLAVAGAQEGSFFLIGGTDLVPGPDGKPVRQRLQDAYRYTPGVGWKRIADLPRPLVAPPGPAAAVGPAHLLVLGGDDGSRAALPPQDHPGFSRDVLAYHTITDTWAVLDSLPFSLVTTSSVSWGNRVIVAGGEARPGVRSTEVWSGRFTRLPRSFGWLNYATLSLYLAGVAGVGFWFMRRQKSTADYFKGGGRIPWWAAGLSIFATMLSSITFMAVPAKAYASDWIFAVANLAALALAPIVIAFYLPFFRKLNVTSAYEYLEQRFNLAVRLYASASFILFQAGRMAVVIYLPALALSAAVGLDIYLCVLFIGVTCAFYTAAGGIEAVIWTDAVQAVVLLGAAVLSVGLIASHLDGTPVEWWAEASSYGKLRLVEWSWDMTTASIGVVVIGSLLSNLAPYTADQSVVQRYITTPDQRQAERAIWMNAWLTVPATVLFFTIGTMLFLFYRQHAAALEPSLGADSIFPLFIADYMPAGVAGIVIAGIFAAAQSTASSSVNSVVTALVTDWVRRFRPQIPDHTCLRLSQWLSVVLGLGGTGTALWLATTDVRSLWDAYLSLLGLLGSGLAGLFALGIFSRRANGPGALVGAIAGAVVLFCVQRYTPVHFLLYGAIGTTTCFACGYLASLFWPRPAAK